MIRGCAGLVIGDMAESVLGRVVLFGKRMGEVSGLTRLAGLQLTWDCHLRVVETCHLRKAIDYFVPVWPWKGGGVVFRSELNVLRRVLEDEITIGLYL